MHLLHTKDVNSAAALVRQRLSEVLNDTQPLQVYVHRKVLRKSFQDCCHPLTALELLAIRARLSGTGTGQLSYAEVDEAIKLKVPLGYRIRVNLPHVSLAWRLRLKDPGISLMHSSQR